MSQFFFSADGRFNRARFWLGHVAVVGLFFVAMILGALLVGMSHLVDAGHNTGANAVFYGLAAFVVLASWGVAIWAGICIGIKRYHDLGKPGAWVLIQFAPLIGGIWYFVEAGCLPGTYGANEYGPDPLHPGVAAGQAPASVVAVPSAGRPAWVIPLLLVPAVLALGLAAAGLVAANRTQTWLAGLVKVEGKVVALQPAGHTSEGNQSYRAVVGAETSDSVPIHVVDRWAVYPPPQIGSAVTLAYPPGKPDKAFVAGFLNLWLFPTLLGAIGAFGTLFWLGVALLVKLLWPRQAPMPPPPPPRRQQTTTSSETVT